MMRTVSPCCQSGGENNRPQARPTASTSSAAPVSQGCTRPARRRKRPGLAKRCRLRAACGGRGGQVRPDGTCFGGFHADNLGQIAAV